MISRHCCHAGTVTTATKARIDAVVGHARGGDGVRDLVGLPFLVFRFLNISSGSITCLNGLSKA